MSGPLSHFTFGLRSWSRSMAAYFTRANISTGRNPCYKMDDALASRLPRCELSRCLFLRRQHGRGSTMGRIGHQNAQILAIEVRGVPRTRRLGTSNARKEIFWKLSSTFESP